MIRRPPRPPIKMMQPIALDLPNSVTLLRNCNENDTRKVKVLSLPETIKQKSTFRAKALRRELVNENGLFSIYTNIHAQRQFKQYSFTFIVT